MPRQTPTPEDIPLPGVQGQRPVAGYDVSAWGQGAQAIAKGVQTLGADVQKSAQDIAEVHTYRARNDALLAQDQILGDAIQLRQDYKPGGPKYVADPDKLAQNYHADLDNIVDQGLQKVPEGPFRTHVQARLQVPIAHEKASVDQEKFNTYRQNAHADIFDRHKYLVQTVGPFADPTHIGMVNATNDRIDDYASKQYITPLEAAQQKQQLAADLGDARARARINLGPAEAAKVERELRASTPLGSPSMYPPAGPAAPHAAAVVSEAETGDHTIGAKALGTISPDAGGSRSYGFMQLNSRSGSAAAFVRDHGQGFGLTAAPGTPQFDAQWKAAATNQTDAFRTAQLRYFNERIVPTVSTNLERQGVPAKIAADPRVQTYFADRFVQMGNVALNNIEPAWRGANGDVVRFLHNIDQIDRTPQQLQKNFQSAIASGVYGPEGHATRLATRLNGALATPAVGGTESYTGANPTDAAYERNKQWLTPEARAADPSAFSTNLGAGEPTFRKWVADNHVPFNPDAKGPQDYDMRGFWKAFMEGDEKATSAVNPNDGKLHYPDYWKTPYHKSFSNESQWASKDAPKWNDKDQLVEPKSGRVVFDERSPSGDATSPDFNPLFAKLQPQHRDALIAHAQAVQRQHGTEARTELQASIKDDLAAATREGYLGRGRSIEDFKAVYGDEAETAFRDYNQQLQMATDMHNMAGMSPQERQAVIDWHRPNPSQPGYAERSQQYDKLLTLNDQIEKARSTAATKERQAAIKDLGDRAKGVALDAARTGQIPQGIPRDEFIKTFGEEQGAAAWNSYTDATQYAADLYHLGEKTPEDKLAAVSAYEPRPGQDNTEQAWQRHDELFKAANALHKQLTDDPTGYMLRNSPPVRESWTKLTDATTPEDQAKAAQDYATKTIAEQQRFGVAPEDVKVVPDSYAENFKSRVEGMALAGNGNQVQAAIKGEQEKWGSAWPQVYRQVTDGDAMLRVVGAGVKSSAGQLLTNNAKVKFGDIVKDEQSAKAKDITENVGTAMAPFASSLVGNAGGIRLYNDVRGQVDKLAAIYAFQNGMNAQDAAKQAAADVIDFKYDYRDGFRIPAKEHTNPAGVPSDQIQLGAAVAKQNLGGSIGGVDLEVRPAIDTFGAAYSPAQLASETADAKRQGRWTTNNDESGLWFVYGGQVVRKPDGQPLSLTWQQLGEIGKRSIGSEIDFRQLQ